MFDFRSVFSFDANTASSKKQIYLGNKLDNFAEDEGGIATVWAMFWLILCFSISGLAIDVTNAWKVHAILQSTADSSALAGAYELQAHNSEALIEENVKKLAVIYAELNMKPSRYGNVLLPEDVQLGYWYSDTQKGLWYSDVSYFSKMLEDDSRGPANTVYVTTRQSGTAATSAVATFFLRFVGFDRFTVATESIATIFMSQCAYDGLIAEGKVILSTKQEFWGEYCVHGEEGIDLANDNFFDDGTIASTREEDTCGQSDPKCKDSSNPGIEDAYMEQTLFGSYLGNLDANGDPILDADGNYLDANGDVLVDSNGDPIRYGKIEKIDLYWYSLIDNDGKYTAAQGGQFLPDSDTFYVTNEDGSIKTENPIVITKDRPFSVLDLEEGMVNIITCPDQGGPDSSYNILLGLTPDDIEDERYPLSGEINLDGIAIMGNQCDFTFDGTVNYANATIITNATGTKTFQGNAGTVLGYDDGDLNPDGPCHPGGEVTLITSGSVHFAAKLEAYDVEIIAAQDVLFAARVGGGGSGDSLHVGTSVTAGGDIHLTTGHQFVACDGMTSSAFDPIQSWKLVW